jgi:hypothetical protein
LIVVDEVFEVVDCIEDLAELDLAELSAIVELPLDDDIPPSSDTIRTLLGRSDFSFKISSLTTEKKTSRHVQKEKTLVICKARLTRK